MVIYNVTVSLAPEIEEEWLKWIEEEHIPDMLGTEKFEKAQLVKIYDDKQAATGSYAVQYYAKSPQLLNAYLSEDAARLRKKTADQFGDKLLSFRTFLNVVSEHS